MAILYALHFLIKCLVNTKTKSCRTKITRFSSISCNCFYLQRIQTGDEITTTRVTFRLDRLAKLKGKENLKIFKDQGLWSSKNPNKEETAGKCGFDYGVMRAF